MSVKLPTLKVVPVTLVVTVILTLYAIAQSIAVKDSHALVPSNMLPKPANEQSNASFINPSFS